MAHQTITAAIPPPLQLLKAFAHNEFQSTAQRSVITSRNIFLKEYLQRPKKKKAYPLKKLHFYTNTGIYNIAKTSCYYLLQNFFL